jgi:hypothetical protein
LFYDTPPFHAPAPGKFINRYRGNPDRHRDGRVSRRLTSTQGLVLMKIGNEAFLFLLMNRIRKTITRISQPALQLV